MGGMVNKVVSWGMVGVVVVTVAVYWRATFEHNFVWDDAGFLFDWPSVQELSLKNLVSYFYGDLPRGHEDVYRPLRSVYYAVSIWVWGHTASAFHGQASWMHGIATGLVWALSWELTKNKKIAGMAGLIFGLHPIHVEAVAWITASFDAVGFVLVIWSTWLWVKSNFGRKRMWWGTATLAGWLAIFSNEMALVLPGLWLVVYGYVWLVDSKRSDKLIKTLVRMTPLVAGVLVYCGIRFWGLQIYAREDEYLMNSRQITVMVMIVAMVKYVWLLLAPVNLSVNHQILPGINGLFYHDIYKPNVTYVPEWDDGFILAHIGVLAGLGWAGYKLRYKFPEATMALGWLGLSLVPVMQIFPQSIIFSERYAYIGSVGIAIAMASGLVKLERFFPRKIVMGVFVGLMLGYGWRTYSYSAIWKDGFTFWSYQAKHSPPSSLIYTDLGREYVEKGDYQSAEMWMEKALEINPKNVLVLSNLGAVYALQGKLDEGMAMQERALKIVPTYASSIVNTAAVYFDKKEYGPAAEYYQRYLAYRPTDVDALVRLAKCFHELFIYNQAENFYHRALKLDDKHVDALLNLGNLYVDWGRFEEAKEYFLRAEVIEPNQEIIKEKLSQLQEMEQKNSESGML